MQEGVLGVLFDRLGLKVEYTVTQALASMHPGHYSSHFMDGQVDNCWSEVRPK